MTLALARQAADAVLYEGYLLYPYRATARKNQVRWQFGVLGPPGAAAGGAGEEPDLRVQCLLEPERSGLAGVRVILRFLHLQRRIAEHGDDLDSYRPVAELRSGTQVWTSWDEAVAVERDLGVFEAAALQDERVVRVDVDGGQTVEPLPGGRLVRRRWPLQAEVRVKADGDGDLLRMSLAVANTGQATTDRDAAIRTSLIGAHLLLEADQARFVSLIDPPAAAKDAAGRCRQHRCFPVLAGDGGPDGQTSDVVLASPIILYDHPAVARESPGEMFDSTEIDEILTLRVMTLTEEEKAQARATDPAAAAIIDRCDRMTPAQLQQLHGVMRDPHAVATDVSGGVGLVAQPREALFDPESPWWDPAADAAVDPDTDHVVLNGVMISRGSHVVLRPARRADAQDIFFAGQEARVTSVVFDVDGETHIGVVLVDDPAADLHDWYGRSLYFAPDELEPVASPASAVHQQEEGRS
jgi:hypothetical protein